MFVYTTKNRDVCVHDNIKRHNRPSKKFTNRDMYPDVIIVMFVNTTNNRDVCDRAYYLGLPVCLLGSTATGIVI